MPDVLNRLLTRFSTLSRTVRAAVWLMRLKRSLRSRAKGGELPYRYEESIGCQEYDEVLLTMIRLAQQQSFPSIVKALEAHPWHEVAKGKGGENAKRTLQPLHNFCPFIADGVIRIGGRLQRSNLPMDAKHPIVLPKRHHLSGLVVNHINSRSGHNASPYVINEAKERFHIIGQERTVKHYINTNCMACRNRRSKVVPSSCPHYQPFELTQVEVRLRIVAWTTWGPWK